MEYLEFVIDNWDTILYIIGGVAGVISPPAAIAIQKIRTLKEITVVADRIKTSNPAIIEKAKKEGLNLAFKHLSKHLR